MRRHLSVLLALLAAFSLIAAACGGDDDDSAAAPAPPPEPPAAAPEPPPPAPADEPPPPPPADEPPPPPPADDMDDMGEDTPATRAIAGIKALNLPPDTTITVFTEDLSILGPEVTKDDFEAQSGIKLDIQKSPFGEYASKILADAATQAGTFDVVLVETNRLGDLDNAGYPRRRDRMGGEVRPGHRGLHLPDQPHRLAVQRALRGSAHRRRRLHLLLPQGPAGGSRPSRRPSQEQYGRELTVPVTYDEYMEVLEFFTRPEENLYGATEWRITLLNYWWFWQRLWSGGGTYFHDDMSAAVNSPAGVQALEDMIAMEAVMSPDALSFGYVESVEAMTSGTAFSNITWPAAGKNANDPETSTTVGKWGYATVPGYVVDGQVNQRSMSAPGYTILVSNYADVNKEAAYLYTQWFTSPENLIKANQNLGGNTDVVRASIFADPSMAEIFPGADEYLDAQKANLAQAVPDPVLPGYGEYAQALEIELGNALTGQKSPQEALDDAAEAWDEITDSYGREEQLQVWQNFLASIAG